MDQIIAAGGITVTMEAVLLNHPVIKKDEPSFPTGCNPGSGGSSSD